MDIRDYWRIVRKNWLAIVLATLTASVIALTYSLTATKQFATTAVNFVAIGGVSAEGGDSAVFGSSTFALQRVKSYTNVVDTPAVLSPVIEQLGLDMSVKQLAGMVAATNPPQTVLLNVSVTGTDPALITVLANAIAESYAEQIEVLETPQGAQNPPVKVTTIAQAAEPTSPVSPRTAVNLALGLLLGLGAGVAYAILREQLDTSVKSPADLGDIVGASPLGFIGFDESATTNPLVALDQGSPRAEAIRTIRTNLNYVNVDNPPRAVAITSPLPGEGKTTTACNLAITLAQAGKRVCLVEADLRRPKVGAYLNIEGSVGLTNVITGEIELDEALVAWNRGLLTVLPSGSTPPNPSELLSSQQMRHVLQELRERFDIVVVDAAPLLPVADGAIVASVTDGAILIARHGKTTRDQAAAAAEALQRVGARTLGVVLNFAPNRRGGYGYGYGYGYYQADEPVVVEEVALEDLRGRPTNQPQP
jgi:capsular exopolysaccharide synthesis family protein